MAHLPAGLANNRVGRLGFHMPVADVARAVVPFLASRSRDGDPADNPISRLEATVEAPRLHA